MHHAVHIYQMKSDINVGGGGGQRLILTFFISEFQSSNNVFPSKGRNFISTKKKGRNFMFIKKITL